VSSFKKSCILMALSSSNICSCLLLSLISEKLGIDGIISAGNEGAEAGGT
jgi:hypothetical protein